MKVTECDQTDAAETEVFTLDEEPEEVLAVADAWLEKFAAHDADVAQTSTSPTGTGGGGPSKLMLLGLFVAFAMIAALIIFLKPG